MKTPVIALVGERDAAKRAHLGIEASLALYRQEIDPRLEYAWVPTAGITEMSVEGVLGRATAVWCVPGSPYESADGALRAIRHARVAGKAFLGTCGGFQHALMEFSRNVLGRDAAHQELTPDAESPLITKLTCSLVGAQGRVIATSAGRFAEILGAAESVEEFNCSYGLNRELADVFRGSALECVAHDEQGQVRAFRLREHPFFVGTLFQPERRALGGTLHPVVRAFLRAA